MAHLRLGGIYHPLTLRDMKIKRLEMFDIRTDVNLVNVSIAYLSIYQGQSATFNP